MREYLAKHFVRLSGEGLASQPLAELPLNHRERGFDVTALVVVTHKEVLVDLILKKEPFPDRAATPILGRRVLPKSDVRLAAVNQNKVHIRFRRIRLVGTHLADGE